MSRRPKRYLTNTAEEEAWINMMPLIDVVFVVLIMFIVIAPMLDVEKVNLAEGIALVKESEFKQDLAIHVRKDNSIWFKKQRVSPLDLEKILKSAYQQNPKSTLMLFQDREASFGTYQDVKAVSQKAGFQDINVILKPKS